MNKSTRIINVIEMTKQEESDIWHNCESWKNYNIDDWNTSDGQNEIKLIDEDFYRPVCIIKKERK